MCHYCSFTELYEAANKNQRFQSVHHQKSLQSASTSISTLVELGKTNTWKFAST